MSKTPDKGTSRRTFLKLAGIAAAGVFAVIRLLRTAWAGERPRATPVPAPTDERPEAPSATPEPGSRSRWFRFTERARRVVFLGQEEATRMGQDFVRPEHLCLALLSEYDCAGVEVLNRLREESEPYGIPIGKVVSDLRRLSVRGSGTQGQDIPLSPGAKLVIDYAYEEARELRNNYVGTEHLLLGLMRQRDGLPSRVLIGKGCIGASLDRARQVAVEVQRERLNLS